MESLNVTILTPCPDWPNYKSAVKKAAALAVQKSGYIKKLGKKPVDLTIVLTDDAGIKKLNRTYRGKNKPTNVLSFPMLDWDDVKADPQPHLGDVVIAYETIRREADAQGKSLKAHLLHMVVHGTLHLFEYDHMTEDEAARMERLEVLILKAIGVQNPYVT